MSKQSSRRSFLGHAAAARSWAAPAPVGRVREWKIPPPRAAQIEHAVTEAVSVEVNARPIPNFEPRDRSRVRFGQLQYRSGLVLTSPYRGFGGLSGIRLDAKGERFLAISDQGGWFTGSIRYSGDTMIGLDGVE
ncbi:esterase-like activity of phytase family protein, partial [Bradyrhizobium japonicum]|uniref:esterase-like activity of phytase family protein n=1 Tax=Bradyrhizobium japonicum TaxID=375 RepID=UPI0035D8796D|nr:twin-arginine translocation pathway signal [Bradyrhizobium japonicum]